MDLQARTKTYGASVANAEEASLSQNPPPPNDLHIERSIVDLVSHPPKGALRRTTYNTYACVAHNYSIVEYLAQSPSSMSAFEVL